MYTGIHIKNFKSFKDLYCPLKSLTVLSGINGIGKSSILQALLLLRQSILEEPIKIKLKGSLIDLGLAKDILHEFASKEDLIAFTLKNAKGFEQTFAFPYIKGSRDLEFAERPDDFSGSLFAKNFFYLRAKRLESYTKYPYPQTSDKLLNMVGSKGEYCPYLLAKYGNRPISLEELANPKEKSLALKLQVEAWLSEMGEKIYIHTSENKPLDGISLQFSLQANNYRPYNVGLGFCSVLPIFVAVLLAEPNTLILIENPEAFLHPKAQTLLSIFFAKAAASGLQIIIETHSDHILNGIRIAAKEGIISADLVALNFLYKEVGKNGTSIVTPSLDNNGRINEWPHDFFDEWENNLLKLL